MTQAWVLCVGVALAVAVAVAVGGERDACAGLEGDDAASARCLLALSTWGALASVSHDAAIAGYPFAGVKSVAEVGGVPVLYLTPLDLVVRDLLAADNRTTLLVSAAAAPGAGACAPPLARLDPMHPFCARLMVSGALRELPPSSPEHAAAWRALVDKHPEFEHYPADHGWFVARLEPVHLFLINAHGPAKRVPLDRYLSAPAPAPAPGAAPALPAPRARLLAARSPPGTRDLATLA